MFVLPTPATLTTHDRLPLGLPSRAVQQAAFLVLMSVISSSWSGSLAQARADRARSGESRGALARSREAAVLGTSRPPWKGAGSCSFAAVLLPSRTCHHAK